MTLLDNGARGYQFCFYILPGRDMLWSPRNRRPERLRDMIKEMEVRIVLFVCFILYVPVDNFPVMSGWEVRIVEM